MKLFLRLLREEDGPTAVEYAVMLALILMACFTAIAAMGSATGASLTSTGNAINGAIGGS